MKLSDIQQRLSPEMLDLSTKLLHLANAAGQTLRKSTEVAQELAKDPFTESAKQQAVIAELLIILLHSCDRIASAAFQTTVPEQTAMTLHSAFMTGLVGATLPAFVQAACPDEDEEEQEETQADLLHLYNSRAIQYGFFSLNSAKNEQAHEPLLTLTGIRLAEALECSDNAEVILHGVEVVINALATLRTKLPLKEVIGKLIAGTS
ncbi:MAG: hypothetical protein FJ147_08205 [Deltaproteobacteria bacterium]|nr:hypothetical protein [Deltaproteobacteria bacterium]